MAEGVEATLLQLYPSLRRFAAVVGPSDVAPDDLVHDAIVAVLSRHSIDELSDAPAYFRRVIVNLSSNERRRLGRRRAALNRVGSTIGRASVDAYPSDLAHLDELTPRARAVLYLHYVDSCSFEEIAELLGLRAGSVRQIASRARGRLRLAEEMSS